MGGTCARRSGFPAARLHRARLSAVTPRPAEEPPRPIRREARACWCYSRPCSSSPRCTPCSRRAPACSAIRSDTCWPSPATCWSGVPWSRCSHWGRRVSSACSRAGRTDSGNSASGHTFCCGRRSSFRSASRSCRGSRPQASRSWARPSSWEPSLALRRRSCGAVCICESSPITSGPVPAILRSPFGVWHLCPLSVLPSRYPGGPLPFLAYSVILGFCYALVARTSGSIRWCAVAHAIHDSLGLGAFASAAWFK